MSLQAELSAEVRRREAAEAQLEQQLQRQTLPSIGCSQPTLHTLERSRSAQLQPVGAPSSRVGRGFRALQALHCSKYMVASIITHIPAVCELQAPSSHSTLSRASSGQLAALHPGTQTQPEGSPTKLPYLGRLQTDASTPTRSGPAAVVLCMVLHGSVSPAYEASHSDSMPQVMHM